MLQRAARARRLHTAAAADPTAAIYDYAPGTRVMTCDGHLGVVLAVADGPYPGTETYDVRLDGGMGGGAYLVGQLQPAPTARTAGTAGTAGTAAADYPELTQVLAEHPDPARGAVARAVASRTMASSSDFDREYQQARDVKFHDRMSGYMNSNGHRMQPVGDEVTSRTSLDSTCPDCGAHLSTGDGARVYDGHGQPAPMGLDTPCGADGRRAPIGDQAYEPDGQPIEQSTGRACENCGTPMGRDAQQFGCVFCQSGQHHGYCCPTLGTSHTAAAEMTLGETIVPNHTPGPGPTKPHSPMDNPASSGWASAPDPDQWSAAPLYPLDSRLGTAADEGPEEAAGTEAALHDEPQAALPSTDGDNSSVDTADPEALTPQSFTAVLAAMHAANPDLDPARGGARASAPDGDIAAAAQAHLAGLSKTSAYDFTPGQRRALIEEGAAAGVTAANADRLDLTGTHYVDSTAVSDAEDEDGEGSWWT